MDFFIFKPVVMKLMFSFRKLDIISPTLFCFPLRQLSRASDCHWTLFRVMQLSSPNPRGGLKKNWWGRGLYSMYVFGQLFCHK